MSQVFFFVIIAVLIFDFLLGVLLVFLDSRLWSSSLPLELHGIYDAERYERSQKYEKAKTRFGLISGSFSFLVTMAMLLFGGFAVVDSMAASCSGNAIVQALVFFGILMLASDILGIPFAAYATFKIEERFGFNRTSIKTFIGDKLKSWLLMAVLGGGILSFIAWVYPLSGDWFVVIAWCVFALFSIFMSMFYSQLIVPLFNKQKPLEEGALRTAVEEFSRKAGFRLDNIFVIDGSKRSKKANAYFTGLGRKKRIVLYDTLIADHSVEELVAVLAHEIGHYKKKHTMTGLISSLLSIGLLLFLFSWMMKIPELSLALGAPKPEFHMGLLAFALLYSPVSMILGLLVNYISRKNEYAADRYAAEQYSSEHLQTALIRLSVNNLSNLRPHRLSVIFHYSHPPLLKRLEALRKIS